MNSSSRSQRAHTPSHNTSTNRTTTAPRSPTKPIGHAKSNPELGLTLERVIGTTCQNSNYFDYLPSIRAFAYTAGAAAVVATIQDGHDRGGLEGQESKRKGERRITQRFFRANPVQSSSVSRAFFPSGFGRDHASPDPRYKSPGQAREFGASSSPWNGAASSERSDWESPTSKHANVKERVKAATAVSFAPNGRFLAVGETGYKPRVLIFSLADKASYDVPMAIISEHTFGVQAVAFSPDSKFLASLGAVNDGFLCIWSIDERNGAASLFASNKCTNTIRQMVWLGQSVITVGLRLVKIWRPHDASPGCHDAAEQKAQRTHKPLAGRNVLLGDLLEATFTCAAPLSHDKAIVCTDGGDVCLVDDTEKTARMTKLDKMDFGITAACLDAAGRHLLVTGSDGSMRTLDVAELMARGPPSPTDSAPPSPSKRGPCHFVAVGSIGDTAVTVDSQHGIQTRPLPAQPGEISEDQIIQNLPAHSDAVLGVRALSTRADSGAAFLTWSASGTVIFWSGDCEVRALFNVPIDQSVDMYNIVNELRAVTSFAAKSAISGDRYGMLRVSDTATGAVRSSIRAHAGEITDISVHEGTDYSLIASSSRDRTVQLFTSSSSSSELSLLQTLDEHAGSVLSVLFAKNGRQLLSCSADRTVVVREAVQRDGSSPTLFAITRTVTLKNSPTSMRLSLYEDTILLSATDRCIQLANTHSGRVVACFKASDPDGGDAVIMSSLAHLPASAGSPIIAGVSSSDKSIRLYSEDGSLLARDWGHTEGVTDIAVLRSGTLQDGAAKIVTVAADGTIFIWDTVPTRPVSSGSDQGGGLHVPAAAAPPLRKVISHSELARFQQSQCTDSSENDSPSSPRTATHGTALSTPHGPRRKSSKLSIKSSLRLEPMSKEKGGGVFGGKVRNRSPTPPPPSPLRVRHNANVKARPHSRGSVTSSHAEKHGSTINAPAKSEPSAFGTVAASTQQLCRTLKAYRHRLEKDADAVTAEKLAELEHEINATSQFLREVQRSKQREVAGANLDKDVDKMSISSWTEVDGAAGTGEEELTPRQKGPRTPERSFDGRRSGDDESSRSTSSLQEVSFVTAEETAEPDVLDEARRTE